MLVLFGDMGVGPVPWHVLHQARESCLSAILFQGCQCLARRFHDRRAGGATLDSGL